ncbi:MAG: TatD family hydrolase [Bacteroidales bacterium]|nr:TatD family hydrolase [Bacteroidales bacterium]
MKYIDIGINLMHKSFNEDREKVVKTAETAGVSPLIITGTSERSSREAAQYAALMPNKLYSTVGVHPHDAKSCNGQTIPQLRQIAGQKAVVAIGECGLDYNRDFSPRDVQRKWFEKQIQLAAELRLPLFLHERDAFEDFSTMLQTYAQQVSGMVVHCFTGTDKELDRYIELGCYIGITGWICDERRGTHLAELVKHIPADRLMIETDAPFLAPRDMGNIQRNEPKYLPHIAEVIARHLKKTTEQTAAETYANTCRFFGIVE